MDVFISCDMEGITGIIQWHQVDENKDDYKQCRLYMTEEVNAAIRGAFNAGAKEVVVNDSHGSMSNILPDKLDERAKLISGNHKVYSMMEGIYRGFDAAMFIGYHARRGTPDAVLNHTYTGSIFDVTVNGIKMGETGINGALAGYFGIPLVLVAGDDKVSKEARKLVPNIYTVTVKEGLGQFCALNIHPKRSQKLLEETAEKALRNKDKIKPLKVKPPIKFEVVYHKFDDIHKLRRRSDLEIIDNRIVKFTSNNYQKAFLTFLSVII